MNQEFAIQQKIWPVYFGDTGNIDAFGRLRTSSPEHAFDSQFTYDLLPLIYEPLTNGAGVAIAHDTTNRLAQLSFAASPNGSYAILQSFEHVRYQPGRSHTIFLTFNFISSPANCAKFVGYSDGLNGIELRINGGVAQFAVLSGTTPGNQTAAQNAWNIDRMDGTGPSGVTLDWTKCQILVIDLQALYTGRVRCGFDIDGRIWPAHEFCHCNDLAFPYIQSANLPIRAGMACTDTTTTTMRFICASVASEGGQTDVGGFAFTAAGAGTAGNGARTHILSVRPITTFAALANRMKFVLESVEALVTGNSPVYLELCLGQAISGATGFTAVNATYSGFEFNTAGTISGSPAIVIASGYLSATATTRQAISRLVSNRYPITLDAAGAVRALGTMSLIATGLGGNSAMNCAFNWREIR